LNLRRFTIFSTDGASNVKNLNTHVPDCRVMYGVQPVWVHGFFYGFSFVDWSRLYFWVLWLIFNFSIVIFLLTTLGLDLFSDA